MNKKIVLLIFLTLILASCSYGNESDKLVFTGTVEADEIDISSEISGKITKIYVSEGQSIKKGDKIAKVDTTDYELQLKKGNAALMAARANLNQIIDGARNEDIKSMQAELKKVEAMLEGAEKNYEYRLKTYNNYNQLLKNEAVPKQQVEDAKALLDAAEAEVNRLEKQYESINAKLDLLLNGATEESIRIAEAEVNSLKAEAEIIKNKISKGKLLSPKNGVVESVNYEVGELVPAGGNVATVVDLNDLWVCIYIPEKNLHLISLGKEVKIVSDYFQDKDITGKVVYISSKAEFTPKNVESKENKEEMVFEVKIKILNKVPQLKPGMFIDVLIEGDN